MHDDTAAIQLAITQGSRCGASCNSSTIVPAVVYFPPGTYLVSATIIQYYNTQFLGDVSELFTSTPLAWPTPGEIADIGTCPVPVVNSRIICPLSWLPPVLPAAVSSAAMCIPVTTRNGEAPLH